jgi:hypothetical protein
MSRFDTLYGRFGRPWLLREHGRASVATYTAPDESQTELAEAIVGPIWTEEQTNREGITGRKQQRRELSFSTAELAGVALTGTFTIDSEQWAIEKIVARTANTIRVQLRRAGVMERSRPQLRSK